MTNTLKRIRRVFLDMGIRRKVLIDRKSVV